jgi:hypothetical protein
MEGDKMKIWIYHNNKFRQVDESRIIYPQDPMKSRDVKFITRRWKKKNFLGGFTDKVDWEYVSSGKTKEECLEKVNFYTNLEIAKHEEEIAKLKLQLVKLD